VFDDGCVHPDLERHVYCPPLVRLGGVGAAGYLLAWLRHDRDGSWRAIVTWVREAGGRYERHLVETAAVQPVEPPAAYRNVPRLTLGVDGAIRPWDPPPPDPP
jgi:hypothetical protein